MSADAGGAPESAELLVCFVHGLGGGRNTWGKPLRPSLHALVAQEAGVKTHILRYPTSVVRLNPFRALPSIQTLAEGLGTELELLHPDSNNIVLVGHSLGGLIAREFIRSRVRDGADLPIGHLVMFGTPNGGADLARFASRFSLNHRQLRQLEKGSGYLEELNRDWERLGLDEIVPTTLVVGGLDNVVDVESARDVWGSMRVQVLNNRNHRTLVKPKNGVDDLAALLLLKVIADLQHPRAIRPADIDPALGHAESLTPVEELVLAMALSQPFPEAFGAWFFPLEAKLEARGVQSSAFQLILGSLAGRGLVEERPYSADDDAPARAVFVTEAGQAASHSSDFIMGFREKYHYLIDLAGARERNESFLRRVCSLDGVESQSRFINSRGEDESRIAVWSLREIGLEELQSLEGAERILNVRAD